MKRIGIVSEMQTDFKQWFYNFWYVLRKHNQECSLYELKKKHDFHKRMGYSWLITNLFTLVVMIELFSQGKASLTIMVLYLATLLCLYDEMQTKGMVELFMFWKGKNMVEGESDGFERT